jgi:ferritin
MKNFLDKLRKKTDAEKTMIAFVSAAVITFVIASTWFTWTLTKEEEITNKENNIEEVTPLSNLNSQFGEIKDLVKDFNVQFKESKEILKEINSATNSTTTLEIESSVQ